MKKQTKKGSRKLLWILLAVGLVLVAATAVTLALIFGGEEAVDSGTKLYWNVERSRYVAKGVQGTSSRMPESDGYYYVKMAVEGEQIDVKVADPDVVNRIEFQKLMGLEFDENGIVTDVIPVAEFTGGIVADQYVIESISRGKITVNTSLKYKGISITFDVGEYTNYWEIGDFEPLVGAQATPAEGDQVIMVQDYEGRITDVFVFPYVPPGDVYWNINRMYDSTLKVTTREPDEFGYYVYDFAVNGEIVTLKTRDKEVADYIDAHASQNMGLRFDEDGNIAEVLNAGNVVCGGGLITGTQYMLEQNGDELTMGAYSASTDSMTTITETIGKDCKIFDVSGQGAFVGQPITELKYGDRLICLRDRRYQLCVIFVASRLTENDIYWVTERNQVWDRENWVTTRQPAEDGWYYLKLAVNGEQIVAKTQDAALVNTIDSYVCWCLELSEDRIIKNIAATSRYGGSMFAPFYTVTSIEDGVITAVSGESTHVGRMTEDCVVYNVSAYAGTVGEPAELQVGDSIYGFRDLEGRVPYIFVTSRSLEGRIYWNVSRLYDSANKVTTRQPDAQGRYWFEMVVDGQVQWLWTGDKDIATKVDSVVTRARGLHVVDGQIQAVLAPNSLKNYKGVVPDASWVTVKSVSGNTVTAVKSNKETVTITLASDCLVYNVTNAYSDHRGEKTSIRVGDTLVTLANENGEAVIAYVCGGRTKEFNTGRTSCDCDENVTWVAWDGTTPLTTGHYYLTRNVTAPAEGWTVSNMTVHLRLDGHTITGSGRVFKVTSGTLNICDHGTRGTVQGKAVAEGPGGVIQVANNTAQVNLYNIDLKSIGGEAATAENGGVLSASGWASLYNVNVSGGHALKKGGNIAIMPTGNFRMFGGSVADGTAKLDGGNLYVAGNTYLEGVTVSGGTSGNNAGSIGASVKDKTFIISGGKITGAEQGLNLIAGELTLKGAVNITDNTSYNLKLGKEAALDVGGLSKDAKMGITMAQPGKFAESQLTGCFTSDSQDLSVVSQGKNLSLAYKHSHCACGGKLAGHTCENVGFVGLSQALLAAATEKSSPVRLSGTNYILSSGNYYLTEDITLAGQLVLTGKATLCLNGHTISGTETRVFAINGGTLNITDCQGGGKLVGGKTTLAATILLQGSKATNQGNPGTLNIYAGTIVGGTTTRTSDGQGGNIYVWGGTLNVYGGELIGGTSVGSGGNVILAKGQSMNIYGGKITAGTAPRGKGIYVVGDAKLSISGTVQIEDIAWTGESPLNVTGLKADSKVGLTLTAPGVFAENAASDLSAVFTVPSSGKTAYDSKAKTISYVYDHGHCVCGGLEGHACTVTPMGSLTQADFDNATETSSPVSLKNGSYTLRAGSYYLKEDITLAGQILVTGKVDLCLNGKTMTATTTRAFAVSGGTLNITDCGTTGKLQGGQSNIAATILLQGSKGNAEGNPATVNIYGGTVAGGKTTNAKSGQGGNIYVVGGTLNVYGGTLTGGQALGQGGNVIVGANQTLNLYGGQLTSGTASAGDCLYVVKGAAVTLDGDMAIEEIWLSGAMLNIVSLPGNFTTELTASVLGVFAENVQTDYSGCFTAGDATVSYSAEDKTLSVAYDHYHCVCGGKLEGLSCVNAAYKPLTQADFDNATADTAPVSRNGANFTLAAGSYYLKENIVLPGQVLITGSATRVDLCLNSHSITASASRVFAVNGSTVHITDCGDTGLIQGGKTATAATILVQVNGKLFVYGGTVRGGQATTGTGGNIALTKGTVTVYGGTFEGGTAKTNGGNIFVAEKQTLHILGGKFTSGTAGAGDCIYVSKDAKLTLSGSILVEDVYLASGATVTVDADAPLDEDSVGISMEEPGVFANEVLSDCSSGFTSNMEGLYPVYAPETKTLSLLHSHCLCVGDLKDHACEAIPWTGLSAEDFANATTTSSPVKKSGSNFNLAAGSYYLTGDIDLTGQLVLTENVDICLNGHSLKAPAANRAIALNGKILNLTDCGEDGSLVGGKAGSGATVYIQISGNMNLYGGTVVGGTTTSAYGGAIAVYKGKLTMYGGAVTGGDAKSVGGAILVNSDQAFDFFGGNVTSGTAGEGRGECIYAAATARVTVGGTAQADEIFLSGTAKLSLSAEHPLEEPALMGINMGNPRVFLENVETDLSQFFKSNMANTAILWDPSAKSLALGDPEQDGDGQ